jgi:RNA polymerase sigma-70 factor (ECF subfamily)
MGQPAPESTGRPTFAELLAAVRGGSREALGQLLEEYRSTLLRFARAELPRDLLSKEGGSDLVQESFLDALEGIDDFRGVSAEEFWAWLRRILFRNLSDFRRHYEACSKRQASRERSINDETHGAGLASNLPAADPDPPAMLELRERIQRLERAMLSLPARYRQVIVLHTHNRLPFEAVGSQLGCSGEAARKLYTRAVREILAIMDLTVDGTHRSPAGPSV